MSATSSISPIEAIVTCFQKYTTFEGRARRSEYWWFALLDFIIGLIVGLMQQGGMAILGGLINLALVLPSLAVAVRRLHDIGKSGWNILWQLVPIVNIVLIFVWYIRDSDQGTNAYGVSPKYRID